MEKSVQITLIIAAAIIIVALIGVYSFFQVMPVTRNTVNVQGTSQVKAVPDLVSLYFSVQTQGTSSQEANDKNSEIVDNVITNLVKLGFERKEITTEGFNVYPDYSWSSGQQKLIGYKASHNIKLEMSTSRTDKIGGAIDAGVDAGALVRYINFELSVEKQNEYKALALKQASEDARIKAESVASGLGKRVGSLVSVSVSDFGYSPWALYSNDAMVSGAAEAKSATTSIQPGEKDINANVQAVFSLK
ncbi:MAG: SIMPL domain-containing protein [Nanoarchaeota archaeon]|nr:SIMPL domain-containing protein [Nanoarchaeota archaeon]MBU4086892.1 SIMPL domain-containing protein [Nanoarchaeota archaeon]